MIKLNYCTDPVGRFTDTLAIGKGIMYMKTVGIIAEYNPFHNGHAYQIATAKKITGADYCIVIMSGDFVQRGAPAIMDKFIRAESALANGADLVIELPVYYSTSSAEYFASGAVALLDKLGVADTLCFGSECGDIETLYALSEALLNETPEFKNVLKQQMKLGATYPQARNHALSVTAPHLTGSLSVLQSPNNILGLEYIKALKRRGSKIQPHTLSRLGAGYHAASLEASYSSALAIRESIRQRNEIRFIEEQIPSNVYALMEKSFLQTFPILPDDLSLLLPYKLLLEQSHGYISYLDIDAAFSDRLTRTLPSYTDYTSFCEQLKTRNMTYTRVSRNLLHILLDIFQKDMESFRKEDYTYYARLLGFKKEAEPLLGAIKERSAIPLLSKLADAENLIDTNNGTKMLDADLRAGHIYSLLVQQRYGGTLQNEYQRQIIVM